MDLYREIVRILENGEKAALATVIGSTGSTPGKESAKMLIRADGTSIGSIGGGCTEADVWALARKVIETEQPIRQSFKLTPKTAEEDGLACGGIVEIFIEPIGGARLYVFGAGHIGRHLVKITSMVGLSTTVVDDRPRFANRELFPEATEILVCDFSEAFQKLNITENAFIVIVTRGHRYDQLVLSEAIKTPASYIGLIGSKSKIHRIFSHLTREGADPERLKSVRAPIGLDIGARTPEEIAVSIAAQLIAHRRRPYIKGNDPERPPVHESSETDIPLPSPTSHPSDK